MGYSWSQQDESVGAGFVRIATEQLAKAALNADAVGDPPAGRIHAARRNCKRLRGLFRLVRSDFADYDRANAAVRDAADRLSAVRDAAVM
ncbi:MAG: CHAD domain-containing protein, partial [Massilia sp.]